MNLVRYAFRKVFTVAADIKYYLHFGGTDVLLLYKKPPGFSWFEVLRYRALMKLWVYLNPICYINSAKLEYYLRGFGFLNIVQKEKGTPQNIFIKRQPHADFNVLFYLPLRRYGRPKYINWIYGAEFLEKLQQHRDPPFNIVVLDGTADVRDVYPIIDCYVKINRMPHSDMNRVGKECIANHIPAKAFDVWQDDFSVNEVSEWIIGQISKQIYGAPEAEKRAALKGDAPEALTESVFGQRS